MSAPCPLPVDWLDFVEGAPDPELDQHLGVCPSCAALVDLLADTPQLIPHAGWADGLAGRSNQRWEPDPRTPPQSGQLWLTTPQRSPGRDADDSFDGIVVLLLGDPFDEAGAQWARVVPVRTDVEEATLTDYLLLSAETTLEVPGRLILAHDGPILRDSLAGWIGELTGPGRDAVAAALRAEGGSQRWGTAAGLPAGQGAHDRFWDLAVQQLRGPWLEQLQPDSVDGAEAEPDVFPQRPGEDSQHTAKLYWFRQQTPATSVALAAGSSPATPDRLWKLDAPVQIEGQLKLDWETGHLLFRVASSRCTRPRCRMRLVAQASDSPEDSWPTEPFDLADGVEVRVAEKLFPHEISQLAVEFVE